MINNKLNGSKGPRSGFRLSRKLVPVLDKTTLTTWTLSNNLVTFNFIEDPSTGVRLDSWKHNEFDDLVYNSSSDLWSLGMVTSYKYRENIGIKYNPFVIKPSKYNFVAPRVEPTREGLVSSFTFTWRNVQFDKINTSKTCDVTVVASLSDIEESIDLSVSVTANDTYSVSDLELGSSSILQYVGFPTILLKKGAEVDNQNTIFSDSRFFGYTLSNPHKYLRTPRYRKESFQYKSSGERLIAVGDIGWPASQTNKYNYGCPGNLAIPCLVFGNRQKKEGTLIYALDPDGTNPKQFQWYAEDNGIFIKTAHISDDCLDPNGVGGYYVKDAFTKATLNNVPRWSLKILPFKSPTRWVDWKGYQKYREVTIQKNMDFGWMPDSFYNRYVAGELTKQAAEIPAVLNAAGFTTGDGDILTGYKDIYSNLYKECINPNFSDNPRLPVHFQSNSLNGFPKRGTDPNEPSNAWWSWEPWANQGTGVGNVGPDMYFMPDITGVHPKYQGPFAELNREGCLPYVYSIMPFAISSGSTWTQEYSGIDLVSKIETSAEKLLTEVEYEDFVNNLGPSQLFSFGGYKACMAIDHNVEQEKSISSALGSEGVGQYHDTVGLYGRGCLAKSHVYLSGEEGGQKTLTTITHPRSPYSRYYNDKQYSWVAESVKAHTSGYLNNFSNGGVSSGDFNLAHASEHVAEVNIGITPIMLTYEGTNPYLRAFVNYIESEPRTDVVTNIPYNIGGGQFIVDNQTDSQIDAFLSLPIGGGLTVRDAYPERDPFVGCLVDPPNWIQRCPAFNISYSDRVVLNEWSASYVSNYNQEFWFELSATGTGQYGQLFYDVSTGLSQREQFNCYVLSTWPYTNRVSISHIDASFNYTSPTYANGNLSNEFHESEDGFTGVWSGYKDELIQKILRVQAYNPDYIYHGTFYQPLEDYQVGVSNAARSPRQIFTSKSANIRDPYTHFEGHEKIAHFVRKHRNSEKYLFVAGNWTTGTAEFTGTFDPEAYGITTSYQVKTLEVNNNNHGTWSLVSNQIANDPYTIDLSLGEADFAVYSFEADSSSLSDFYSDLVTDYTPVRYKYNVRELKTTDLGIAYTYSLSNLGDIVEQQIGYKAPATQEILNNLPQWMEARQNVNSNAWKFTNSWGMSLQNTSDNLDRQIENLSLLTIRKYQLHEVDYISLLETINDDFPVRNLLFNSSFSVKDVARSNMPLGWVNYKENADLVIDKKQSTIVPCSLKSELGTFKFGQDILFENKQVDTLVGSFYVLSDASDVDISFTISVELINGTSKLFTYKHTNRSSEWVRISLPCSVNDQVYRANFIISSKSSGLVRIAAPQLEQTSLSGWTKSTLDSLPYYLSSLRFNSVYALPTSAGSENIPIFVLLSEDDFIYSNIPTRIESSPALLEDVEEVTDAEYGKRVDQLKEVTRTEFVVYNDELVERAISPSKFDLYGKYDIKDLRLFEDLQFGTRDNSLVTIKPIATALRDDILFVLCEETYNGVTKYIIKTINPKVPPAGETYLESIVDFDLNLDVKKTYGLEQQYESTPKSISFVENNPNYLIVTYTNNVKYYFRMYFDYAFYNTTNSRLYFREKYTNSNLVIS